MRVEQIREYFKRELKYQRFTTDKTGAKTIEMLGASFLADEPAIFGEVNHDYVDAELKWYASGSTNINDIYQGHKEPPAAWKYAADPHGEINSNYGHLIYSPKYFNQFENAVRELKRNPDTRRAIMVYNRPSMWYEYDQNGRSDFICTNAVTYYIRNGKLHAVVQMRSNDVVFGYKNDRAWAIHVMEKMIDAIQATSDQPRLEMGDLYWQVQNLHVYERHFDLVK